MKKIMIYGIAIFLVILLSLFLYNLSTSQNEKTIKIGVSAASYIPNAPIIVAQEKGFFKKHGLKVEIVPFNSGSLVGQTLATGNIDIGSTSIANFLIANAKGAPVKMLATSSLTSLYLFVNPTSNITTFSDLSGKTIGARSNGGAALILGAICEKENIDFKSLKFVEVDQTVRQIALMKTKIVDAIPDDPDQERVYEAAGAAIHQGWEEKGYANISSSPGTTDIAVIEVNTDFMSKNPKAIKSFIDAYIEGHQFIKNNPDEAADLLSQYIVNASNGAMTVSKEDIKRSWDRGSLEYNLWYNPDSLVEISKIAQKIGLITKAPTLEQMLDTRFEEKLNSAQNEIYG